MLEIVPANSPGRPDDLERSWCGTTRRPSLDSSPSRQDRGLELLDVLSISLPTPRGQEAQLDQVVEAHRIACEDRIDNASGKEEDDQDQFSSCVPTYLGLIR
jgi:hypothetical protein